jgi:hypothetical protein
MGKSLDQECTVRPSDPFPQSAMRPHFLTRKRRPGAVRTFLEKNSALQAPSRWVLAGSALVLALIVAVAWIARANVTATRVLPVASPKSLAPETGIALASLPPPALAGAPAGARFAARDPVPPLVMLAPSPKPAPTAKAAVPPRPKRLVKRAEAPRRHAVRQVRAAVPAARKPQAAPKAEPMALDSDAALIGAVVARGSRHAGEKPQAEQKNCSYIKKC